MFWPDHRLKRPVIAFPCLPGVAVLRLGRFGTLVNPPPNQGNLLVRQRFLV